MSRNSNTRRAPAKSGGGILVGIFIGLVFGALIAAGAAWYFTRANPFQSAAVAPAPPTSQQDWSPRALPGKPGDRPVVKQDFEFYKILPQGEPQPAAPVDEAQPKKVAPPQTAAVKPEPIKPAQEAKAERLYLQIGAFIDPAEADNLKARLALAGIAASAQRVRLADGRTVHRVRGGPFASPEQMNPMRARLAESGFAGTVTRAGQ